MDPNPLFPYVVNEYKNHLRSSSASHLSFQAFCLKYNVRIKSVEQWMHRHGLNVGTLRYEVLLEQCNVDPDFVLSEIYREQRRPVPVSFPKHSEKTIPVSDRIKSVTVTFPDGIVVNIRQTSVCALAKFIESSNRLNEKSHVQPE